jgi:uncharacterized protein YbaP (TraB family)
MRRKIITLFFSLLLAVSLSVQAQPRGALFKVQAKGNTMYLFGTMHIGQADFYPLEPRIKNAIAKAPALALEIDPLKDPSAAMQAVMQYGMIAPGGQTIQDQPPAFRERLDKALRQARINPAQVATLKPWMLATILALAEYTKQGGDPALSVDTHLAKLAREARVPVVELESIALQMGIFDRMSADEQWRFLDDALASMESGKQEKEVRDIIASWSRADRAALDKVARQVAEDKTLTGRFFQKVLLEERNGPMADKLMAMLEKADGHVAGMGVLHLLGTNSVPALMKAKGAMVERVY